MLYRPLPNPKMSGTPLLNVSKWLPRFQLNGVSWVHIFPLLFEPDTPAAKEVNASCCRPDLDVKCAVSCCGLLLWASPSSLWPCTVPSGRIWRWCPPFMQYSRVSRLESRSGPLSTVCSSDTSTSSSVIPLGGHTDVSPTGSFVGELGFCEKEISAISPLQWSGVYMLVNARRDHRDSWVRVPDSWPQPPTGIMKCDQWPQPWLLHLWELVWQ